MTGFESSTVALPTLKKAPWGGWMRDGILRSIGEARATKSPIQAASPELVVHGSGYVGTLKTLMDCV